MRAKVDKEALKATKGSSERKKQRRHRMHQKALCHGSIHGVNLTLHTVDSILGKPRIGLQTIMPSFPLSPAPMRVSPSIPSLLPWSLLRVCSTYPIPIKSQDTVPTPKSLLVELDQDLAGGPGRVLHGWWLVRVFTLFPKG